jgi:hypothetical protein
VLEADHVVDVREARQQLGLDARDRMLDDAGLIVATGRPSSERAAGIFSNRSCTQRPAAIASAA